MRRHISQFTALYLCLLAAGCLDANGNRVTVQKWWQNRSHAGNENENASDLRSQSAAEKTEQDRLEIDPSDHRPAPSGQAATTPHSQDQSANIGQRSSQTSNHFTPRSANRPRADKTPPPNAVHSDALIVNNEIITVNDILEPILPTIQKMAGSLSPEAYYHKVSDLVRQQLVDAVAQHLIYRRASVKITDQIEPQIQKAVEKMERERINREFGGLETVYEKYLQKHRKTRQEVRDRLRRAVVVDSYLRETLVSVIPPPRKRELLKYYRDHLAEYSLPERREMFLIDIMATAFLDPDRASMSKDRDLAKQHARDAAGAAQDELMAGRSFEEVARTYSKGLHKNDGGAWGFISAPLTSRWQAPSRRLFQMQEGDLSRIIESGDSFFIVKLGRVEGRQIKSFQEAQPEIIRTLTNQSFRKGKSEFLQKELERSTIGSLDAFLSQVIAAVPNPQVSAAPP